MMTGSGPFSQQPDTPAGSNRHGNEVQDAAQAAKECAETELLQPKSIKTAMDHHFIVAITNVAGRITYANGKFCKISGYSQEELIGQNHRILKSGYHTAAFYEDLWSTIRKGNLWRGDVKNRGKDGSTYWVDTTIFPTLDHCGRITEYISIRTDITERKRVEETNLRLARIVQDSVNEIYVFDADTLKFLQVNTAARKNLGYTREELCNLTPLDLKPEYTAQAFAQLISPLRLGETRYIQFETRHRRKDGSEYDADITLQQIRSDNLPVFAAIIQDVTERKATERELIQHRNTLQELVNEATTDLKGKTLELEMALASQKRVNEMQRQFVSMASHEFRTPLAIIDGNAQRLKRLANRGSLPLEALEQRVDKIRVSVARMTRLMESTLTAARMDDGKISIEIAPCDIRSLMTEVCAHYQEITRDHIISCDTAAVSGSIWADAGALEQVLSNLLSNAVKYASDAPEIDVTASTESADVVITVRDQGIGIDDEDLPRMFERFFRAKSSTGIAGTGIGLNLVKTLVEMHDGSVDVESTLGRGSIFMVRLPINGPVGHTGKAA